MPRSGADKIRYAFVPKQEYLTGPTTKLFLFRFLAVSLDLKRRFDISEYPNSSLNLIEKGSAESFAPASILMESSDNHNRRQNLRTIAKGQISQADTLYAGLCVCVP